ncbi:MAG: UDP-N-acetylmuramate dehydrogenase [Firmicutes bacterium]|nr:UDP-N-acetylmuramate dehydrogenase [Bacillota bacterium]
MDNTTLALQLENKVKGQIYINEPMSRHTSFRIGGPADVLVIPKGVEDILVLIDILSNLQIDFHIIGAGTNILVKDKGIKGVVIKIANTLSCIERLNNNILRCGAGTPLPSVCRKASSVGLTGLEFAGGIPGTAGGAVAMNAAAFGGFMAELVDTAEAITYDGEQMKITRENLEPGTKTTRVLAEPLILTKVDFALQQDDPENVQKRMEEYFRERACRQPMNLPSAGCAFKNPTGEGAGRFIDAAGLKGVNIGGAKVSRLHANFIVNDGSATARDVILLMRHIQEVVYSKFEIMLEPEVRILGG